MKKLIAFVLTATLLVSCFALPSFAEKPDSEYDVLIEGKVDGESSVTVQSGETVLVDWVFTLGESMDYYDEYGRHFMDGIGCFEGCVFYDDTALELVSQDEDDPDDLYKSFSDNYADLYTGRGGTTMLWNTHNPETGEAYNPVCVAADLCMGLGIEASGESWFNCKFKVKENTPDGVYNVEFLTGFYPSSLKTGKNPMSDRESAQYNIYNAWLYEYEYKGVVRELTHDDRIITAKTVGCQIVVKNGEVVFKKGDVNKDNSRDAIDACLILKHSLGLEDNGVYLWDNAKVSKAPGEANSVDALLVLQYSVKLIDSFPVEEKK